MENPPNQDIYAEIVKDANHWLPGTAGGLLGNGLYKAVSVLTKSRDGETYQASVLTSRFLC